MKKNNFIIYAPPYNEKSGGIIVLHKLCDLLNQLGFDAKLWPFDKKLDPSFFYSIKRAIRNKKFKLKNSYNTPIANKSDLKENTIVVYPEIVDGNPLNARRVVRWLLHKPGYHTGQYKYGTDESFFYFNENCIKGFDDLDSIGKLKINVILDEYKQSNFSERSGSCYMLRKADGTQYVHPESAVLVDNLNHSEMAEAFNRYKYFYCYDEMTFYSHYASACGCISIVISDNFNSREEWLEAVPSFKNGIAFGVNDIDHAIATQHKTLDLFDEIESESLSSVRAFIRDLQGIYPDLLEDTHCE